MVLYYSSPSWLRHIPRAIWTLSTMGTLLPTKLWLPHPPRLIFSCIPRIHFFMNYLVTGFSRKRFWDGVSSLGNDLQNNSCARVRKHLWAEGKTELRSIHNLRSKLFTMEVWRWGLSFIIFLNGVTEHGPWHPFKAAIDVSCPWGGRA